MRVLLNPRIVPIVESHLLGKALHVAVAVRQKMPARSRSLEAAHIDGASRRQILTKLVLPLIRPGIAAVAVIGAITTWNDYITIVVFAPDTAKRTLQVALVNQVFDAVGISWSFTMAFALIASLPVILMFLVVQKWFIAGLTAGAVKG